MGAASLFIVSGPKISIVDGAVRFGQRQHAEAVIVHAIAEEAGLGVLAANDVAEGFFYVAAVDTEVGIFAGGQKRHECEASDGRAWLAVVPAAFRSLRAGEILKAVIVHFANVAGNCFADVLIGRLSESRR